MPNWRRVGLSCAAATAGTVTGLVAERLLMRRRHERKGSAAQIGDIAGDATVLAGPGGVRLQVETYGPEGGGDEAATEIVLVHAFAQTARAWHEQVIGLRDRHRLVTYDQPGHGRSSAPTSAEFSLDLLADALATVVERATQPGRGRLVLVGHSLGGMTALGFARRHEALFGERVGALLLLSTTARTESQNAALGLGLRLLVPLQTAAGDFFAVRGQRLARVYRGPSDLSFALTRGIGLVRGADPRYVELTERLVLDTELATILKLLPVVLEMNEEETLAKINVPTVIVVGSDDRLTPVRDARHMARSNPDVRLVEIPGVGHMTPLETHGVVNRLIRELAREANRREQAH
ncbi:MAG: alpha/beta fold hydrolase [Nitriliruptorales bacterium]